MDQIKFYKFLSRFKVLNYRAKIMVMAFVGTHIPLLALISFYVLQTSRDWTTIVTTIGVALTATLVGTGITLFVLNLLLRPVMMTSRALRQYRDTRTIADLPTGYTDEAGTLMADAHGTMSHLETILERLEHTDLQTGLPNRARFTQLVADALAERPVFVAALRFENHERLTAAYDQAGADDVMVRLAGRLGTRPDGLVAVARIDGDVFAAILAADSADAAGDILARQAAAISGEIVMPQFRVLPDLRGGIAEGAKGDDAGALIDNAIAAIAVAEKSGQVKLHTPQLRETVRKRFDLEQDLRRALKRDEFVLHYQPVIDARQGKVVAAEALVRWNHPEHGLVAPGLFIPVAEASGLIDPIGVRVMELACAQMRDWDTAARDPIKVAVNLSARQFSNPSMIDLIRSTLSDCHLDGDRLEVELTETVAMADHEHTQRAFSRLRDIGVSVAIDDFGTGYASMSYLRKLNFDKLKIDREFVSHVDSQRDSQAICAALCALADGMGLSILAEGTERAEEVSFLQSIGCSLFQGFYFSRPVAARGFEEATQDAALLAAPFFAEAELLRRAG